jgi:hypothetical protein
MKIKFIGIADSMNIDHVLQSAKAAKFSAPPGSPKFYDHLGAWAGVLQTPIMWLSPLTTVDWNKQQSEPVKLNFVEGGSADYWLFRNSIVAVTDANYDMDDIKNHIKLFMYKRDDKLIKLRKEVERFERFEKIKPVRREQIPEEVRMYVWRRDGGKCVQCGSNRNLEYDHIIPVSKGGSHTERNIQLLCGVCNKRKSDKI